ncbi:MAG: response regulator transcription factor [Chitinophagaceae bacterium]|nr:MAG: response regulator transcription factor [Chitinophagaceae bacterium]
MINQTTQFKVALADDHALVRNAIAAMVNTIDNFKVVFQADNGEELVKAITDGHIPDIVLLDLSMPKMNGQQTATWLTQNHPAVAILVLTEFDSELTLIRLLQMGVRGFLRKDSQPNDLKIALTSLIETGYYYSNHTAGRLINFFRHGQGGASNLQKALLSDQELDFLQYACSDRTYKEIAVVMKLNVRTVDTIRDQLFLKLDVKSRVGLVIVAMKHGIHTY